MKATFDRKQLDAALRLVTPAIARTGGTMPVLSGVRLHAVDGTVPCSRSLR